jgi:glycosyltransferase involved in cell wall biosynthesis
MILLDFQKKINTYMRIAMIGAKGIPAATAQGGGIESHVEMLAVHLTRLGHHLTVYVRPYANPERRKIWENIRLITLPSIRSKNLDTITHVFLSSIHVLFQKVDIIHYHGVGPSTLAWIPRLFKPHAKIVVTFHSRDQFHEKWNWLARLYLAFGEWTTCHFPHLTIAAPHHLKLFCEKMYGRRAVYIPNAVDLPNQVPGTSYLKQLGVKPDDYLMTLGRLLPVKAQDDAIQAFVNVRTDKKLLIVGEATPDSLEYKVKLERLAMKDERVILLGEKTGEELQQLLAHCFCLIHPSRVEGLSMAVLEAMAHGRLVVMSDIPGNRELVDHSGVAYPSGDVKALEQILNWILSDPVMVRIRGARAREVVEKVYNWNAIALKTEAEYHKLLV